jgi:hypothetical protein
MIRGSKSRKKLSGRIQIRIKLKARIRIHIRVKGRIRFRIRIIVKSRIRGSATRDSTGRESLY